MTDKYNVLFLCVHNSARSQMAEALLRMLASDRFNVESAGFEPRPVHPLAVEVMRRAGIDISDAKSRSVFDLFRAGRVFQYVITVCDEATAELCPIFPGVCERLHWSFPDPSALVGTEAERIEEAAKIRDTIRERIELWLSELERTGGRPRFGHRGGSEA